MTDLEEQDAQAQAVLAELRSAAVPDVVDSSYQSQLAALGDHAQSAFNEVLAQYRFMGLVCGIKGPNDSDQDVENARDAIMEAISDFLHPPGGPLSTQISEQYRQYRDLRDATDIYDRFGSDEAILVQDAVQRIGSIGHPSDTTSYAADIVAGRRRPDLSRHLAAGHVSEAGMDYINAAAMHYEEAVRLDLARRELAAQRRREWWQGVWDGIRSYYDENMELIRNGQWLLATGRIAIDAMVFAAEEVVITGLMAGIVAITGGLLAGVALALRAALRAAISVARLGTRSVRKITAHWDFKIELRKVEPGILYSNPIPVNVSVTRKLDYEKTVNVETDLTRDEARAMGEGGQGSTRPDADTPEAASGARSSARWQVREVAGRRVYQRNELIDPNKRDRLGRTNKQRMLRGLSPLGPDGLELNLHHVTQDEPGPMAELVATQHSENHRLLHIYANQYDKSWRGSDGLRRAYRSTPPTMDRRPFDIWKKVYWKERAYDF